MYLIFTCITRLLYILRRIDVALSSMSLIYIASSHSLHFSVIETYMRAFFLKIGLCYARITIKLYEANWEGQFSHSIVHSIAEITTFNLQYYLLYLARYVSLDTRIWNYGHVGTSFTCLLRISGWSYSHVVELTLNMCNGVVFSVFIGSQERDTLHCDK